MKTFFLVCFSLSLSLSASSSFAAKAMTKEAKVFFVSPKEGATLAPTFTVKMGVSGFKIRPAGEDVKDRHSGHHHLIIDGTAIPAGEVTPADATHIHFGKGQTQTELTLAPGDHTLTLQFADGAHLSYGEALSTTIHVHVK